MSKYSMNLETILSRVQRILDQGIKAVGFVSPSHCVPQMKSIISGLNNHGYKPVIVYNTNGYDKPSTLREIENMVDVYLPDLKYIKHVKL